jgi:hypothetical protein
MGARMIHGFYSEDGFDVLYQLANDIAVLTNPQLFYNIKDLPIVETLVEVERLKEEMEQRIS